MDDIAESAGVTKPLVYQHFRSKRALYFELVDSVTGELLNVIRQATVTALGPRQLVELGFAAYFNQVVSHEPAFQLLFDREGAEDPNVAAALLRVEDALAEAIEPLIAAGLEADHRRRPGLRARRHGRGRLPPLDARVARSARDWSPRRRWRSRPAAWRLAWPTSPGRACDRCTPTEHQAPVAACPRRASEPGHEVPGELPDLVRPSHVDVEVVAGRVFHVLPRLELHFGET